MILPWRATPETRHHSEFHQHRITIDRVEYMKKARMRSKKRECRRAKDHDWDGPIQPHGTGPDYAFSYCTNCKSIKWGIGA